MYIYIYIYIQVTEDISQVKSTMPALKKPSLQTICLFLSLPSPAPPFSKLSRKSNGALAKLIPLQRPPFSPDNSRPTLNRGGGGGQAED